MGNGQRKSGSLRAELSRNSHGSFSGTRHCSVPRSFALVTRQFQPRTSGDKTSKPTHFWGHPPGRERFADRPGLLLLLKVTQKVFGWGQRRSPLLWGSCGFLFAILWARPLPAGSSGLCHSSIPSGAILRHAATPPSRVTFGCRCPFVISWHLFFQPRRPLFVSWRPPFASRSPFPTPR